MEEQTVSSLTTSEEGVIATTLALDAIFTQRLGDQGQVSGRFRGVGKK